MLASKDRHDELRSLIVYYKTHCCACSGLTTNRVKGVVGGHLRHNRVCLTWGLVALIKCPPARCGILKCTHKCHHATSIRHTRVCLRWVEKEVVVESPGLGSCRRLWVARERLPLSRCELIAIEAMRARPQRGCRAQRLPAEKLSATKLQSAKLPSILMAAGLLAGGILGTCTPTGMFELRRLDEHCPG